MGIYINGLDFHASNQEGEDRETIAAAAGAEGKRDAIRSLAAEFHYITRPGRAIPSLSTMSDIVVGERNSICLAA